MLGRDSQSLSAAAAPAAASQTHKDMHKQDHLMIYSVMCSLGVKAVPCGDRAVLQNSTGLGCREISRQVQHCLVRLMSKACAASALSGTTGPHRLCRPAVCQMDIYMQSLNTLSYTRHVPSPCQCCLVMLLFHASHHPSHVSIAGHHQFQVLPKDTHIL